MSYERQPMVRKGSGHFIPSFWALQGTNVARQTSAVPTNFMSLDKSIKSGKEHRKPYRGAKRFDKTCRNHGSCSWCRSNRTARNQRQCQSISTTR